MASMSWNIIVLHLLQNRKLKLLQKQKNQSPNREITNQDWLYADVRLGCPWGGHVEPLFLIIPVIKNTVLQIGKTMFGGFLL